MLKILYAYPTHKEAKSAFLDKLKSIRKTGLQISHPNLAMLYEFAEIKFITQDLEKIRGVEYDFLFIKEPSKEGFYDAAYPNKFSRGGEIHPI